MSTDLNTALKILSERLASHLQTDEELLARLASLEANYDLEELPRVGTSIDISIPIVSGYGSWTSDIYHTVYITISGNVKITAPDDGTSWKIVATDIAQSKQICERSECTFGTPFPIPPYKTGWTCQVKVEAWCSNPNENTTLKLHVDPANLG
jgi:hypothetical protein